MVLQSDPGGQYLFVIDGSRGEGGGQILRTSLTLSSFLREPVKLVNIRAMRPKPGLARQHLAGIEALGMTTGGIVEGDFVGSREVTFFPSEPKGGTYTIDIGTAGSISLVLQTLILPSLLAGEGTNLILRGGTDVKWSPTIDYLDKVLLPLLSPTGVDISVDLKRRGYYPKGCGHVEVEISPASSLSPFSLLPRCGTVRVSGVAHSMNLPDHVVERMVDAAIKELTREGYDDISMEKEVGKSGPGTGAGITLWAIDGGSIFGSSCIGERGKPAEKVGGAAALRLLEEISSGATVDIHTGDQLLPFIALGGGSFKVREVTSHARTNISVIEEMLDCEFSVAGSDTDGHFEVSLERGGITYTDRGRDG